MRLRINGFLDKSWMVFQDTGFQQATITVYHDANFNTRDVSNLPVSITLIKNEEREKEFSSNKLYIYEVILRLKFHGLFNKERKKKKRIFTSAIDSHPSYKTCQSVGILASDRAYIHI